MKILFNVLCLNYGGAEKQLTLIANSLKKRGHDIIICNFNILPTVQKVDKSIKVIDMPQYNLKLIKRFQQFNFMKKVCKQEKPDLMISFLFIPNFLTAILGKLIGIPSIISERGDPSKRNIFVRKFNDFADGAVFQTDGAKQLYSSKLQKKGVVIPNPVITKQVRYNYYDTNDSIAFCARFDIQQKRQDLMVEAFNLVLKQHPNFILNFYGDGPDEEKIKQMVKDLGIENNVFFNGVSSNVHEDMIKSRIFVLTSDYEGIPNVLMEAMSVGMPCISTDCHPGGARLLIDNGINGLLVKCNDKNELCGAICSMIENKNLAIECGKNALRINEDYKLDNIIDKWENYCFEIINRKTKK